MADDKKKGLGLPQTKGTFQMKGVVTGTKKDNFSKTTNTKKGNPWRVVNFGLQVAKDSVQYLTIAAGEQEKVYFSMTKDKKTETVSCLWKDRFKFSKEGFRMIGVNVGLEKTHDEKGNEVNDKKIMTPYDACEYISKHLTDGVSVYVRGNVEYSHFSSKDGSIVRSVKLVPTQISLCQKVDFDEKDSDGKPSYEVVSDFSQNFVFMGIEKDESGVGVIASKVINYQIIEDAELVVNDTKLAGNFKKSLKPYTLINTWGKIETAKNIEKEETSSDDGWGSANPMNRSTGNYRKVFVITGADPNSIDKETFTEQKLDEALEAMKSGEKAKGEFGDEDWGGDKPGEESESAW